LKLLSFDLLQGWHTGRPMRFEALRERLSVKNENRAA